MQIYKITLIKDIDIPNDLDFLRSPIGRFCREIGYKKWLTADADSTGHQLMADFAKQFPGCFEEELLEVDWDAAWTEEQANRKFLEERHLQYQLWKRTAPPRIRKRNLYRTLDDGTRQAWNGFRWIDIEEGV